MPHGVAKHSTTEYTMIILSYLRGGLDVDVAARRLARVRQENVGRNRTWNTEWLDTHATLSI